MPCRRFTVAVCVAPLLMVYACGGGTDAAARDTSAVHAAVTDSLVGPGVREGTWQDADEHSTWRAMLDGPRITQVDEVAVYTDSTRSVRQFRFDSSEMLASLREERTQTLFGEKATPDTLRTIIELEWELDSLARSAKRVDGVDRLLQPFEVDNFRAHAAELLRTVRAGTTSSPTGRTP